MGWLDNIFAAMQNEANSQEGFNEKNKWVDLSSQAAGSVEGDVTGASQVPSNLGDFSVPAAGSVEGDVSGAFPTPTSSHPQTQHSVDYSKLPSYYAGLLDDYPEELDAYNYNTGLGYDPTMFGWWTPPASAKDIDTWTANTDTDPGLYLEEYYPVAKTQKSDIFTQGLAEAQNKRARSAAKNRGNEEALKNLEEEKNLWENDPEWIKKQEEMRNQLLSNVGRSSNNQSSSQESSQESSSSNNNSSTPYIFAPTPHGGSEAYPTDQVMATFYDALVDEGINSGYSEDVAEILDNLDEDTAIRLYLNSLGPEAPQYDSYFDFMSNSSADEKNALMHAVNLLTGQYDQYYDDDGNFLGFWTDDMKWGPDNTEEWLSPEVYSAIVSGLPSARAFAQYLVDSYPKDLKDADIEDLAMELLANSVESRMMSGNRGMDLQTYNDILASLTESSQIPYDVGVYKEGGEYSAHDNAGNVNDWNALLYGETPADRYAAIAANFPGEDTSKANLTTNQDWADWWSQVALANGLAANVNYNKRNSNK